jgi:hypothetical protein
VPKPHLLKLMIEAFTQAVEDRDYVLIAAWVALFAALAYGAPEVFSALLWQW